ncbi:urease accessory protein UreE [uncultured Aureimonas sp.]|uniref:urease accessory protein UreE n=1 Tax=uncultured Aureimonas sp. TaxID=1604662 RepID=UPI0025E4FA62|nr:urease accessory protein UreE [uncultured Aureimonas sp.]
MIEAGEIRERGHWQGPADDTITLDEAQRHRRRMAMVSDGGIAFLLDLPEARLLVEGDAIALSDGRLVEVKAKPEPLLSVGGRDADHLLQIVWQIGNRHLPCQIRDGRILLRRDHVVADMLKGLGAHVHEVEAAFDPVGGAYAGGHHHGGHHHGHD